MTNAETPVTVEQRGRVLLATMDDGRANAMSTTMSGALRAALTRAQDDPGIGAMVIAGRSGRFSGGFDLNVIRGGDADAIREMVDSGGALVAEAYGASVPAMRWRPERCCCWAVIIASGPTPR